MFGIRPSISTKQSRLTRRVRSAALTISLAVAGVLGIAASSAQAADHDTPFECRGEGVDPTALIRAEADIVIDAPLSTIWNLHTDVEGWPSWQAPVLTMDRLDAGPLRRGSQFHWTTPAPPTPTTPATTLAITSTVRQVRRQSCVLWTGPAVSEAVRIDRGTHLWLFTEVPGGVHVHTEETWKGAQVEADVPLATKILRDGLEQWLRDMKSTAEAGTCDRRRDAAEAAQSQR